MFGISRRERTIPAGRFRAFLGSVLLAGVCFVARAGAEISIVNTGTTAGGTYALGGTAYAQNFDSLPSSGTFTWANNATLPGWYAITGAGTLNPTGAFTDGSSNPLDLTLSSVGTSGSPERALAYHTRVAATPTYLGLGFRNQSGRTLESFSVSYTPEQWKEGTNQRTVTITVQYRVGASAADLPATSGWTTLASLTRDTLNGSAGATVLLSATDVGIAVPDGESLWLRWRTSNDAASSTSSHDTLAVDNVSVTFTAAPDGSPVITAQPESQTVNLGTGVPTSATFNVVASGDAPLAYQWKKGGADIPGATSSSYTIPVVQEADAGNYSVVVTNGKGSATSAAATLTVTNIVEAPEITTQPQSQTVDVGATVQFSVVATGGLPLSYQWLKNGAEIAGATGSTLTLTDVAVADAATYRVVVSNSGGSFTSQAAVLALNGVVTPPVIVEQSGSQSVVVGGTVAFTVTASGTAPFTYQWTKDGQPIAGANSLVLALSNVTAAAAGEYNVVVSNDGGSATGEAATLTVTEPPAGSDTAIFVAPNGLAENPGTFAQPTTLARAITLVPVGGTIFVRGGTYTSNVQITVARGNNGGAGQHKRIFAYTPPGGAMEKPVFDFSSQPYGSTSQVSNPRGLFLGGNYWHVKGLEVKGAADNGIFVAGNHNIVELCVTHKNRDSGLQIARYSSAAPRAEWPSHNLILNCESYDNYDSAPNGGENADGFACKLTSGPGNIFRGCVAHHNIDDGWDLYTKSDTGPIDPVIIDQCISYNNGTLTDGTQNTAGDRNGFKLGGEKIAVAHYVSRSIAFGNGKNGFTWNSNPGAIQMVNNLAFDNAQGNYKFDLGEAKFFNNVSLYTASSGPGNRVGVSDRYVGNSGAPTGATNVFWFTGSSSRGPSINDAGLSAYRTTFISLTPPANGFARNADGSLQLGDFGRPLASSALINAGALPPAEVLAWLPYDSASYYEGAPDLGAVESYFASPPSIATGLVSQSVLPGVSVTFSVSVTGTAPFTYVWKKGDTVIAGATTDTFTLASAQLSDSATYTVTVANDFGQASSSATLTVNAPAAPAITTQPQSLTVTEGNAAQFTVVATGTPALSYQWRKDEVAISGATSATYTIAATQLSDAGSYSVLVSNAYGSAPSAAATLTIDAAPAAPTALDAAAVSSTGFTAQWTSVSGATSYRLDVSTSSNFATFLAGYQNLDVGTATSRAVTGLSSGTAYYYRVRAIHAAGPSPFSNVITALTTGAASTAVDVSQLTWFKSRAADSIAPNTSAQTVTFTEGASQTSSSMYVTTLPSAVAIAVGQKVTFSFTLQTGSSLPNTANALRIGFYNHNGTALTSNPGGDSNSAFTDDTGYMASYVFNTGVGALYGRTPNSGSSNQQQLMGTTGEYTALGSASSSGTAAAFAPSTAYTVAVTLTRLASSTEVAYTVNGGATANYTVTASDTASGSLGTSSFNQFGIRVAGGVNSINQFTLGNFTYSIESAAPSAPAIITAPTTQHVPIGGTATFTVAASGTAPLSYQWRKNDEDLPNATASTLTLTGVTAGDAGSYSVVVTNSVSSVTSAAVALTVFTPEAPAITTPPQSQTVNDGANVTFTVAASGTAPLSYQWRKDGTPIANATSSTLTLNAVTPASAGQYSVVVSNLAGNVTSVAAVLTVNAVAPSITTQPTAQSVNVGGSATFTVAATGTAPLAYQWQKNGGNLAGATSASYTVANAQTADAGDYRVLVSNSAGTATSQAVALTVVTPQAPTITAQPQSQTVTDGGNVTFSVTASGTGPFTYQWRKNDADLPNATGASLTLTGVTPASAGDYSVVVTNVVTSVTSSVATLTVTAVAPTIATQPTAQSAALGGSATFSVVATGTAPLSYQWQKNGSNVPGATGASYTIGAVQLADFASYRVVVSNSAGSVTSATVTLTLASGLPVTAFNLTGFATVGTGTSGGGVIPESDPAYRKVSTPLEFVQAIIDSNKTAGKVKVIEILNDLNLGWTEVGTAVQTLASNALREHAAPKLHPVLKASGVSILDIKARSPLTIFSAHGATIRHCNFNIKGTSNIIIRNLRFDELWEWDEVSKGDYDSNDWDFITIGNGGAVANVWIDHCTFTKAYDGIIDMKVGTKNVTVSWCRIIGDDGATNPNSFVRQQLAALEATKSSHAGYRFLRDTVGYTVDEIAQMIQGHDKGALMGATSLNSGNATLTGTFHHVWFENVWDRVVPRLRGGNVHNYNIYVDDVAGLAARRMRDAKAAAALTASQLTSFNNGSPYKLRPFLNGTISTEGGAILVEKSFYSDCLTPLRNNQTDPNNPVYTGKILATDTIYRFNNTDGSVTFVRGNSTDPNNPLGPFQATVIPFSWTNLPNNQLPYTVPSMDDPADLPQILTAGAGAGVLTWSKDNWLRTAYVADPTLPPSIVVAPQSITTTAGADTTFTVQAAGSATLVYQWKKGVTNLADNDRISGSNTAVLTIAGTTADDAGDYSVTVSNANGSITSTAATLTVGAPVAPGLATQPQSQTVTAGQAAQFSVVPTGSAPFSYQWRKGDADIVGATGAIFEIEVVRAEDAGTYSVVVSNLAGTVTSATATLTVTTPQPVAPAITAQPQSASAVVGTSVSFSVTATGTGPLAYQWFRNNVALNVTTSTLTIASAQSTDAGDYQVIVSNSAGVVESSVATLTVTLAPDVTHLADAFADGNRSGQALPNSAAWFTSTSSNTSASAAGMTMVVSSSRTAVAYFTNASGSPVTLGLNQRLTAEFVFQQSGFDTTATGATFLTGLFQSVANPAATTDAANGFTASGAPNTNARVTGDFGSGQPGSGVFADYTGYAAAAVVMNAPSETPVAFRRRDKSANAFVNSTAAFTTVTADPAAASLAMSAATDYRATFTVTRTALGHHLNFRIVRVSDGAEIMSHAALEPEGTFTTFDTFALYVSKATNSASYNFLLKNASVVLAHLPVIAAPSITAPPASQTVNVGSSVTFMVAASGPAPLSYQWRKGGEAIAGATGSTYTIASTTAADAGEYDVVVSNGGGSTTSSPATLTVNVGGFAGWQQYYFTAEERANPALSGPNASAAGDGVSNLFKYALGLNPRAALPGGWHEIETAAGGWVFAYQRPADRSDITYAVEISSNLATWTSVGVIHELESTANGTETWRAIYVPPQGTPSVFFRLKVTK